MTARQDCHCHGSGFPQRLFHLEYCNRDTLESVRTSRGKVHTGSTCMPHGPQCGICGTLNIVEHCAIHTVEHCATLWHIVPHRGTLWHLCHVWNMLNNVAQCATVWHKVPQSGTMFHKKLHAK